MRFFYFFVLPIFLVLAAAYSSQTKPRFKEGSLKVLVDGIPSERGTLHLALSKPGDPKQKIWKHGERRVKSRITEYVFDKVPFGEWIISVFHDENDNKILDRAPNGEPVESYGFSNDRPGSRGIPNTKQASFFFAPHSNKINITVK